MESVCEELGENSEFTACWSKSNYSPWPGLWWLAFTTASMPSVLAANQKGCVRVVHWSITSFVTSFVTSKVFVMRYELRNHYEAL